MIVRKEPNGTLTIIAQTDHSRLVGQLAAHWGNAECAAPQPYESVVRAATYHDYGWLRYETGPLIDPDSGEPYQFLEVPLTATQLAAYQWSLDWMADIDSYSGLIVNMHRTGLWQGRYQTIKHPTGYNLKEPSPEIRGFIAKNEARQQRERARLDDRGVWTNYRLMQVWDLLGLYFCCQEPYDDHIEPVPVDCPSDHDAGVRLTMTSAGGSRVAFEPYPFDERPCHIQLGCKRLATTRFSSLEEFRRAWFQADTELLSFELVD